MKTSLETVASLIPTSDAHARACLPHQALKFSHIIPSDQVATLLICHSSSPDCTPGILEALLTTVFLALFDALQALFTKSVFIETIEAYKQDGIDAAEVSLSSVQSAPPPAFQQESTNVRIIRCELPHY